MAGVALFLSHDAVFLVQLGPGQALTHALRDAAHDYWGWASTALVLFGIGAATATALRLSFLRRRAAQLGAVRVAPSSPLQWRFAATWLRLFAIVAIGFAIQENVEHLIGHGHAVGLGALLGPEYPLAVPVIALITAVAALLTAVVRRTEGDLLAVISAALRRPLRAARLAIPTSRPTLPRLSPLASSIAGRAPPRWVVVQH